MRNSKIFRMLVLATSLLHGASTSAMDRQRTQRRAMTAMVKSFVPTVEESQLQALAEIEFRDCDVMTNDERDQAIDLTAQWLAEAADDVLRHARERDPESTRASLHTLLRELVRLGRLQSEVTSDDLIRTGRALSTGGTLGGVVLGMGSMFTGLAIHSAGALYAGSSLMMAGALVMVPWMIIESAPYRYVRVPGLRFPARVLAKEYSLTGFWPRVRKHMKEDCGELHSAEDLGRLIARELGDVTLDQACASALLVSSIGESK